MRTVLSLLWTALFVQAVIVQARSAAFSGNFDACVLWAAEHSPETNVVRGSDYSSYKCEGTAAERLFLVPDACLGDSKLKSENIRIARRQDDGTYIRVSWESDTAMCGGQCDARLGVLDDKLKYSCQVHTSTGDRIQSAARGRTVGQAGPSLDERVRDLEDTTRRIQEDLDAIKNGVTTRTSKIATDLTAAPKRSPTYSAVPHRRRIEPARYRHYGVPDYCLYY